MKIINNKISSDFYEFLHHAKYYVSADIFSKGLIFLSIPIMSRLLAPEEYGVLAVIDSFTAICSIIFGLGIRGSTVRYFHERKKDFNQFLGSNIIFILIWGLFGSVSLFFLALRLNRKSLYPMN